MAICPPCRIRIRTSRVVSMQGRSAPVPSITLRRAGMTVSERSSAGAHHSARAEFRHRLGVVDDDAYQRDEPVLFLEVERLP